MKENIIGVKFRFLLPLSFFESGNNCLENSENKLDDYANLFMKIWSEENQNVTAGQYGYISIQLNKTTIFYGNEHTPSGGDPTLEILGSTIDNECFTVDADIYTKQVCDIVSRVKEKLAYNWMPINIIFSYETVFLSEN